MASMRVHELAKEFGMTSKELLDRLQQMKIPAKNHASTLVDAYVDKIRKELGPELAERAAAIEAAAAKKAAAAKAAEEAEQARKDAERKAAEAAEIARREEKRKLTEDAAAASAEAVSASPAPTPAPVTVVSQPIPEPKHVQQLEKSMQTTGEGLKPRPVATQNEVHTEKKQSVRKQAPVHSDKNAPNARPSGHTANQNAAPASSKPVTAGSERRVAQGSAAHAPAAQRKQGGAGEAKKIKPTTSKFDSLLSQIEAEKARMSNEAQQKQQQKQQRPPKQQKQQPQPQKPQDSSFAAGHKGQVAPAVASDETEAQAHDKSTRRPKKEAKRKGSSATSEGASFADDEGGEDRYARMAKDAERFQRNRVLADARAVVEATEAQSEGRRKKRKEKRVKQKEAEREAAIEEAILRGEEIIPEGTVKIPTGSTVAEFSELIGVPSNDVIKRLFLLGSPLTLTQTMSDDLIELIADDLGREVHVTVPEDEQALVFYDDPRDLKPRPPVVTVMGHVDHGKTSLLDAIRHTGVAEGEAGGITQHIGASVVHIGGRQITFIDTPGHEAFTAMRARGAKITDVVVLVVAADDGVMPQTVEAIHHAEAAGVPIVVAVNKIDKPGADPSKVRQELTAHGIIDEAWGGQNMFVDVSAKKRIGIDDLLETILLQADVLELKANPDALASGYVIEAKLDRGRGPVATMLIQRGTLRVGDSVVVGTSYGRVRAMVSPKGDSVDEAYPADPVEVLGLSSVPDAGDEFRVFEDERDARNLAEERSLRRRLAAQNKTRISLDNLFERIEEGKLVDLNLVVKADVQGSIEALQDALDKMDQSEVRINVIHSAVGGITETDVTLAAASEAIIIGFNVRPQPKAKVAAEREKVDIRTYRVIYEAIDDINQARVGLLQPDIVEVDTGSAEVRDLFRVPKAGTIAGCYVTEGEMSRDDRVRVVRDGTVVHEGTIASLRRFKDDVKSVKNGYECGISIDGFQDVKEGDVIEAYRVDEVARTE